MAQFLLNQMRMFIKVGTIEIPHDFVDRRILRQYRYDAQLYLKTNSKGERNESD